MGSIAAQLSWQKESGLSLHSKPRTLVLGNTRSFTGLIHALIELESVNTTFSFGRIVFWTGHYTLFQIRSFFLVAVPKSQDYYPDLTAGAY
jgi:uncharacterized protein (DUF1015 family)